MLTEYEKIKKLNKKKLNNIKEFCYLLACDIITQYSLLCYYYMYYTVIENLSIL